MKPTEKFLREKYEYYNNKHFQLPNIDFIGTAKIDSIGKFLHYNGQYGIVLSEDFDYSEDEINILLLHEMCHFYLYFHKIIYDKNYDEKGAHGEDFIKLATKIGDIEGYNILNEELKFLNFLPAKHKPFYIVALIPKDNNSDVHIGVLSKKAFAWYKGYLKDNFEYLNSFYNYEYKSYKLGITYNSILENFDVITEKGHLMLEKMNQDVFNRYILKNLK